MRKRRTWKGPRGCAGLDSGIRIAPSRAWTIHRACKESLKEEKGFSHPSGGGVCPGAMCLPVLGLCMLLVHLSRSRGKLP